MSFSFGCRVNEAEKQQIDTHLLETGFLWDEIHPTFYIINTCAVTGKAEREVRQHIYQTRKRFPHVKIIATGCSATLWMKNNTTLPEVDCWIENSRKKSIPAVLQHIAKSEKVMVEEAATHDKFLNSGRLMVKIQDGCNRFCSYCIVPYTRDRAVSRTIADIIQEIKKARVEIHEVILTAINTEYFGIGTGETLTGLLDAILTQTDVPNISFGSIHPWSITPEFIEWYRKNKDNPRFIHFFHIPIQSGSDTVLRYMNRHYTTEEMMDHLQRLYAVDRKARIATDVIVGFPGETDTEFEETYDFLKRSPITKFHVFRYSARPGTAAATLSHEPTPQEKQERSHRLLTLGKTKLKFTT